MKVLDPQSALLTTAEVHEFLKENQPRKPDKQVGFYRSVELSQYRNVIQDVERYIKNVMPHITTIPPAETWMHDLLVQLKKYELTKAEVFSLINLGVGLNRNETAAGSNGEVNGSGGDGDGNQEREGEGEDEEEAPGESGLNRLLFGTVVEDTQDRFDGDEGEQRIEEILAIIKDTIEGAQIRSEDGGKVNGHAEKMDQTT